MFQFVIQSFSQNKHRDNKSLSIPYLVAWRGAPVAAVVGRLVGWREHGAGLAQVGRRRGGVQTLPSLLLTPGVGNKLLDSVEYNYAIHATDSVKEHG